MGTTRSSLDLCVLLTFQWFPCNIQCLLAIISSITFVLGILFLLLLLLLLFCGMINRRIWMVKGCASGLCYMALLWFGSLCNMPNLSWLCIKCTLWLLFVGIWHVVGWECLVCFANLLVSPASFQVQLLLNQISGLFGFLIYFFFFFLITWVSRSACIYLD